MAARHFVISIHIKAIRSIILNISSEIGALLDSVRKKNGVVHQITNYVTVNDCANITLAVGSSPIMADDGEEMDEIVSLASALVLNMGTLNNHSIRAMQLAGRAANRLGVPLVIDPVGLGASRLRCETMELFLDVLKPQVIRGNMSEIAFLAGSGQRSKGVDVSLEDEKRMGTEGVSLAENCARKLGCVIAITGKTDIISNGTRTFCIENGHEMLGRVTGTGCMCTALVASFHTAVEISLEGSLLAAVGGVATMGVAGEVAFGEAGGKGTASFRAALIDAVSRLSGKELQSRLKLYEVGT